MIGKPKVGDIVKVHYSAFSLKPDGVTRNSQIIDTRGDIQKLVSFEVIKNPHARQGLYRGLNEAVKLMELGDEAKFTLDPGLAFDTRGLDQYYVANSGFLNSGMEIIATVMPNDPCAPESHKDRNPFCVAYRSVPPNAKVELNLILMEVRGYRREIPARTGGDYLCSCLMSGLGLNATAHHYS